MTVIRCLFLLPCIHALQLSSAPCTPTTRPRVSTVRLAAPPPEEPPDYSNLPSDEDLMADFNKRLDAEGGATRFRLKTDAASALEEVKSVGDGIKSSVGKLFDAGSSRPASDGLLAQDQWKTLVIFFGLTIALSFGSALVSQTGGGEKTSDGAPLEFGSRSPSRFLSARHSSPQAERRRAMERRWSLARAHPTCLSLGSRSSEGSAQFGRKWAVWHHAV